MTAQIINFADYHKSVKTLAAEFMEAQGTETIQFVMNLSDRGQLDDVTALKIVFELAQKNCVSEATADKHAAHIMAACGNKDLKHHA